MLTYITWTVDPAIFHLFGKEIRWYGLLFSIGFLVGYKIIDIILKRERMPQEWGDKLFLYIFLGVLIGARLVHCIFYGYTDHFSLFDNHYLNNPLEILKVWEGGLASHGGAIGIIIAVWLFSRRVTKKSMLWTFDRLVMPVSLVGAMIRSGNLLNHEVYGIPTDVPWAFRFILNIHRYQQGAEPVFSLPSHPTQIYEALAYLFIFAVLFYLYWKTSLRYRQGFLFGAGTAAIFTARFFIELIKENQEAFEDGMFINMGQSLSIPFILMGLFFIVRALKLPPKTEEPIAQNKQKNSPKKK